MSWTRELYNIYELNNSREFDENEPVMLPIYHSTANAQIEVTLDEKGNFKGASEVSKEDAVTIIPVTEDSGARSSGVSPRPLADELLYVAGDYDKYAQETKADSSRYFDKYMMKLKTWRDSEHSHKALNAVYAYLYKRQLITDLIKSGVLITDTKTKKLPKKQNGIEVRKILVRYIINYDDINHENKTWKDKSLYESFISFNKSLTGIEQLCYATGQRVRITYKHPYVTATNKLISSKEYEHGFKFQGRFSSQEEALSVSYEFSQKIHNALKWLISNQSLFLYPIRV